METLIDTQGKTFEQIQNEMDFNGFAHFDLTNYQAKNNLPCFISENSEDLSDVESWQSMLGRVISEMKTVNFLLAVAENYDYDADIDITEETEATFDYETEYKKIDKDFKTIEKWAEDFMDSYFLSGDDIWCSIDTKLADYTM